MILSLSVTVPLALFGWPAVVFLLFLVLQPRHAVMVGLLVAWLFLPMYSYEFSGLPNWNKISATCIAVLLGAATFDPGRLLSFRPHWVDFPMAVWCLCPMVSSVLNGYGAYDGLSSVLKQTITWGFPYFLGRLYFTDLKALRELAIAVFVGGVIYVPLCLFEIRMSPQLHTWVYGFHQHTFGQSRRFGGWRPTVFMEHGLAVSMFMSTAGLLGFWLWFTRSARKIGRFPLRLLVPAVLVTAVLCKSVGAIALLFLGGATLLGSRVWRSSVPALLLLLAPLGYMTLRTTEAWDGNLLVEAATLVSADRAQSLNTRLGSETAVIRAIQPRLMFGASRFVWAGMAADPTNTRTNRIIPDGMWLIALAKYGLVGLTALTAALLAPFYLYFRTFPPARWDHPTLAAGGAFAVILVLYVCDNLMNAMANPIFTLMGGALVTTVLSLSLQRERPRLPKGRPRLAQSTTP